MKPTPILFLSDSPSLPTGLARITKDLACLTTQLPEFRVGVLGRGGHGSRQLPFAQYNFPESDQWGEGHIEEVWADFAGDERGVIFTVWDASRLGWFANPHMKGRLQEFLQSGRFERWGYMPVDSYGIGGKLTGQVRDTLKGYQRVLGYTIFGSQVLESTMGKPVDWIPHGYNEHEFKPRDKTAGKLILKVEAGAKLIGCVMTNQARKDWGTAFGAMSYIKSSGVNAKFWVHTDVLQRHWNILALIDDFGLHKDVIVTPGGEYTSRQLSYMYSACDLTILPSLGEGFGYPIVESLACGVPVLHGAYGGGAELIPERSWLVRSEGERLDGLWNCVRPIWSPLEWARKINDVLRWRDEMLDEEVREICTAGVEHLQWGKLWPSAWRKWMLK